MRIYLVNEVGALFSGIALINHIRNIGYVNIGITVAIKYPSLVTRNRGAYRNADMKNMKFSGLLGYWPSFLVHSGETAIGMIDVLCGQLQGMSEETVCLCCSQDCQIRL